MMIRLGITGGIGSGKSYVAQCLKTDFEIEVYETDKEAKRLMCDHKGLQNELKALLGEEIYSQGELNRPLLARYIFSDCFLLERVNAIVHPRVKEDFRIWCDKMKMRGEKYVAVESAILFESGFDCEVDRVVVVTAPLDVRIERVMLRDCVSKEQVEERIRAQWTDSERMSRADAVVVNDGVQDLHMQLCDILSSLHE